VYVGTPKEIQEIRQSLDTVHTRIYRPNYVAATELRALIEPMLTDKVGSVSVSSPGGAGIESNASESGISPDCRDADLCDPQKGYAGGETVLVRDYESVLATLDRVVTEVDVHPMQVTVETTILSVELDGEHHFGVNFQALRGQTGLAASNPPANSPTNSRSEDSGLKIDFLDGGPASLIDALQQMGPTRVLAAPRLMVLDKHSAEILVGEESGCIKAIVAPRILPQNAAAMDTIARLRLRPVICSDGMIRLEVHPELCSGDVQDSAGAAVPRKQLMQVTTEIMVRDGRTLVLRGLLRDERSTASSKVPVLGQLPLIGRPFRKTTVITRRFELMAVITPHVVRDRDTHEVSEPHRSKAAMPATAADPRVQYVQSLLADSEARARETTGAHK
jgi:type II secretory pathway component GspD/PulD (secretin)